MGKGMCFTCHSGICKLIKAWVGPFYSFCSIFGGREYLGKDYSKTLSQNICIASSSRLFLVGNGRWFLGWKGELPHAWSCPNWLCSIHTHETDLVCRRLASYLDEARHVNWCRLCWYSDLIWRDQCISHWNLSCSQWGTDKEVTIVCYFEPSRKHNIYHILSWIMCH